jgi:ADP-ribosylglycohydrolase
MQLGVASAGDRQAQTESLARAEVGDALRDRYVATLIGGAVGDALGRPVERWARADVDAAYPDGVRHFEPWRGWTSGPVGTITDDTQLSLEVAGWLADAGEAWPLDGADFGRRVAAWLPVARGAGFGSSSAARRLADGVPWWESGSPTQGNGVAMRSAAIGLRFQGDLGRLRAATAISGLATHADTSAVSGGVVIAAMVSHLLTRSDRTFDPNELVSVALDAIDGVPLEPHPLGGSDRTATLSESLASVPGMLDRSTSEVFDHFYNGSKVTESLPTTVWLFCRYGGGDVEELLVQACSGGRDADSIAAMCGNLAGALHGLDAFPARWTGDDLEYRDELEALALRLHALRASESGGTR